MYNIDAFYVYRGVIIRRTIKVTVLVLFLVMKLFFYETNQRWSK